jgi:peptidoglycan/LPS O-acetylase OafA/YrhL
VTVETRPAAAVDLSYDDEPTPLEAPAATRPADGEDASPARLPFFPGLEGLRGLAVIAVLLFHGDFPWAVGGYLGVSTFFTLSGFLITLLLLIEVASSATRTVNLKAFYGRRVRRLLPASLAAIALAVVFAAVAGTRTQQQNMGGDVTASLLDVANWHFILQKVSYADLFASPSPLLHYWSLAIEEQFYLVFPLLAFLFLTRLRVKRWRFGQLLMLLMAGSLALTLFAGYSHDRIYFGTDTRAFELLAGGVLAVILYNRSFIARIKQPRMTATIAGLGFVALVACVVMWADVAQQSDWLYRGGLAGYSLLTCCIILAAVVARGPVRWLLSTLPLRRVGELSYAIYVFHWPIFLWIDGSRTGLGLWPLFAVRVTVTVALAVASARLLERPIRRQVLTIRGRRPIAFLAPIVLILLIASWTVTRTAPKPQIDFAAAQRTLNNLETKSPPTSRIASSAPVPGASAATPTTVGVLRTARVAPFGDSTGVMVGAGLAQLNGLQTTVTAVRGWAELGCSLGRGGLMRWKPDNIFGATTKSCNDWANKDAQALGQSQPDIALVLYGPWDVIDRKLPGDDTWRSFGDPVYDAFMQQEMLDAVDTLSSHGALVVWLTSPPVRNVPDRVDRMNDMIEQLPQERPGKVVVLDLASYLASTGKDAQLRPDGIHLSYNAAGQVARDWLIPELGQIWKDRVSDYAAALQPGS